MRRALLATLVALVAAGVMLGRSRSTPDARLVVDAQDSALPPLAADEAVAPNAAPAPADALVRPRSLRGTRVDGGLLVDADGHFVPTLDARRLFDYFLTASGETSDEELRRRIQHEIERRLPVEAAREATVILEHYLAYRDRVRALATVDVPGEADLDARLAALVALRREVLGPSVADAFFADEEADARRMLDARRIADDESLSAEERAARVEAIFAAAEADLPPEVREARAAGRLATTLRGAEAEMRANGADDAAIAAMRERLAGPEAAARLADLDRQRSAWNGRVEAFRAARARVQADRTLAPAAQAEAITRLFAASFTEAERRRIEALDRIDRSAQADDRDDDTDADTATVAPPP